MQEQRQNTAFAKARGLSERQACRLLSLARSSARYQAHPQDETETFQVDDQPLKAQLEQIRSKYPRFGVPRAHALINASVNVQAGEQRINRKRVERVWRRFGMQVRLSGGAAP